MATIPLLEEDATPNSTSVGPRRQRRARALAQLFGAALCCCALAGRAWLTRESRSGADAAVRVLASTPAERAAAASRACELASLVENGPPLPHDPSPPPTLTESFALTLDTGLDRYDARAAAARLSAAFGVKAEQLSAVASAAAGGRVRLDVDVTHARHDALSALGTLNALKPAALDAAAGAMVLRGRPFCVSLLHVNDQHSRVEPVNAALSTWGSAADRAANATKYGGAPLVWGALSARAAALRAAGRHALVVNAGDEFQGSPFFNYYGGNLTADILKAAGLLDLLALGNHEFDIGTAGLARFLSRLDGTVAVRAHNIDVSREPALAVPEFARFFWPHGYELFDFAHPDGPAAGAPVRIALVGVTTAGTPQSSSPGKLVRFREPLAALRHLVPRLRSRDAAAGGEAVDHVVVVSHLGVEQDVKLAQTVPGVSAVIGGHSHTLIWHAHNVTRLAAAAAAGASGAPGAQPRPIVVPVVQARAYSRYIGELQLCWPSASSARNDSQAAARPLAGGADAARVGDAADATAIATLAAAPTPAPPDEDVPVSVVAALEVIDLAEGSFLPHAAIAALVAAASPAIEVYKRTVVGYARTDIRNVGCFTQDCAAGQLVAAAFLKSAFAAGHGAQVGMQNAGGTRSSFAAGNVSLADVMTVAPFQDTLRVCKLSGAALLSALEHGLGAVEPTAAGADAAAGGGADGGGQLQAVGDFPHAFPQLAGLRVCYDASAPRGARVRRAELASDGADDGEAIVGARAYGLATVGFVLRGGDGFDSLRHACQGASVVEGPLDVDALAEFWRQRSPVGASDFPPAVERAPAARGAPAARSGVCARAAAAARVDASPQPRLTASLLPTVAAVDEPPSAVLRAVAVRGEAGAQACSYAPSEGAIAWEVCRGEAGRA